MLGKTVFFVIVGNSRFDTLLVPVELTALLEKLVELLLEGFPARNELAGEHLILEQALNPHLAVLNPAGNLILDGFVQFLVSKIEIAPGHIVEIPSRAEIELAGPSPIALFVQIVAAANVGVAVHGEFLQPQVVNRRIQIEVFVVALAFAVLEGIAVQGILGLVYVVFNVVVLGFLGSIGMVVEIGALDAPVDHAALGVESLFGVVAITKVQQIAARDRGAFGGGAPLLALQIVDVDAAVADAHLLAEIIATVVLAIHHKLDRLKLDGVFHPQLLAQPVSDLVVQLGVIEIISNQSPMLAFAHAQQAGFLVELNLVGPVRRISSPGGIAAAAHIIELIALTFLVLAGVFAGPVFRDVNIDAAVALHAMIVGGVHV